MRRNGEPLRTRRLDGMWSDRRITVRITKLLTYIPIYLVMAIMLYYTFTRTNVCRSILHIIILLTDSTYIILVVCSNNIQVLIQDIGIQQITHKWRRNKYSVYYRYLHIYYYVYIYLQLYIMSTLYTRVVVALN